MVGGGCHSPPGAADHAPKISEPMGRAINPVAYTPQKESCCASALLAGKKFGMRYDDSWLYTKNSYHSNSVPRPMATTRMANLGGCAARTPA